LAEGGRESVDGKPPKPRLRILRGGREWKNYGHYKNQALREPILPKRKDRCTMEMTSRSPGLSGNSTAAAPKSKNLKQ